MFDAIKFRLQVSEQEKQMLIKRFALFRVEERNNKIYWHNKQNANLKQNYGIYININQKGIAEIALSLHKFYNLVQGLNLSNYNDFSFAESYRAFEILENLLQLPIYQARLKFFEYGINLQMNEPAEVYTRHLRAIKTGKQRKPFTWNVYHKKFKAYSTERRRDIRTVYVLYDKTFESRESGFNEVPDNLLRLEIKHKRAPEKMILADLCTQEMFFELKSKFKRAFIDNCEFDKIPTKQVFTKNQVAIYLDLENLGYENALKKYEELAEAGTISKRTLLRRKKDLEMFKNTGIKPEFKEKETTTELKKKILSKLAQM